MTQSNDVNSDLDEKLQEIFDRDCMRLEIMKPHGVHDHKEAIAALHELIDGERETIEEIARKQFVGLALLVFTFLSGVVLLTWMIK